MDQKKNSDQVALFFDLDNTLITTRSADDATCNKVAELLVKNYDFSLDTAVSVCTKYLETFRKCPDNFPLDLHIWRQKLWSIALGTNYECLSEEIYKDWLRLRYEYLALTQETKRFLKSLRQDYLLAIITNGPTNAQWEKVNKLKLKPFFDLILVSGDLPWEKPDKQIFLEACDILGVEPQQCVMIGDKLETDILGGIISKLGGTVWVPFNGNKLKHSDPVPDYIVQNILTIHTILPQIKSDIEARNNKTFVLNQEDLLTDIEDGNSNGSDGS